MMNDVGGLRDEGGSSSLSTDNNNNNNNNNTTQQSSHPTVQHYPFEVEDRNHHHHQDEEDYHQDDDDDEHDNNEHNHIIPELLTSTTRRTTTTTTSSSSSSSIPIHYKSKWWHETLQTIVGVSGNVAEWYDFAIFGFLSDILGTVFFKPRSNEHGGDNDNDIDDTSTIESFAVFGGAFIMRPIGGVIIGYIGDVYGRKYALEISMFIMAGATTTLGCLPSYESVGDYAVLLLLVVRLCQGMSVGGQLMSSLVYTLEHHPKSQWGLYGSFVMSGANFGTFLGGIVAYWLRSTLTHSQLISWGWRLPFLSGFLIAFCGLYLRYYCDEDDATRMHGGGGNSGSSATTATAATTMTTTGPPPVPHHHRHGPALHRPLSTSDEDDDGNVDIHIHEKDGIHRRHSHDVQHSSHREQENQFSQEHDEDDDDLQSSSPPFQQQQLQLLPINPLQIAFSKGNIRSLLASALVPMAWSGGFYFSFVWLAIYMTDMVSPPIPAAFGVNSCSLLLLLLWFPLAGMLSDKFGRIRVMSVGGLALGILGPLLVIAIASSTTTNEENSDYDYDSPSMTNTTTSTSIITSTTNTSSMWIAFGSQLILGLSLALWGAPMCAWLVESFSPEARLTSVAIGYNVAQAIAGGFSPVIATLLVDKVSTRAPGALLLILSIISLIGLWWVAPPPPPLSPCPTSPTSLRLKHQDEHEDEGGTVNETIAAIGTQRRKNNTTTSNSHQQDNEDHYHHDEDEASSMQEGIVSLELKEII